MFKIDCYVEDKNLAAVLRALSGLALDVKPVPVVNATVTRKGNIRATHGDSISAFVDQLRVYPTFSKNEAETACRAIGLSPTSHSYMTHKAIKRGLVTSLTKGKTGVGNPAVYEVTNTGASDGKGKKAK